MAVDLFAYPQQAGAFIAPSLAGERSLAHRRASPDAKRWLWRSILIATTVVGLLAFVLGVGNRFTNGPLFIYIPEVNLIPPLDKAAWEHAFVIHQQSPLFALCGGYQVGGMESLTVYQMLYMWEWVRAASVVLLAAGAVALIGLAVRDAVLRRAGGNALRGLWAVAGLAAVYAVLRYFADHAGLFATLNFGQHRHAVDVTFASVALAGLLAAAVRSPNQDGEAWLWRAAWAVPLTLDIGFGALFEATDAGAMWNAFPGYGDGLLPTSDRLFAFDPVWRNLTENVYLIQACHRVLSFALWSAAFVAALAGWWLGLRYERAALLFGLLTLEGALGATTLVLGLPLVLSIVHQFFGILVLAAALSAPGLWRGVNGRAPRRTRAVV